MRILKNPFSGDYTDTKAVKGITSLKLLKSLGIEPCTCQVFDDGKPVGLKHRLKGPVVIQIAPSGWSIVAYIVIAAVVGAAVGALVSHLMRENIPDYSKVQTASSLRGGSNQARPGQKVPILLGTHRIFADVASLPYSSYSGNQQFLHQLFCWGYDNTVIANADIKVGDTLLSKLSGVSIEDTVGSIYPSRCIETYIGIKLVKKSGEDPVYVERSTPSGTVSLRFGIMAPNGIYKYDDDNDRVASQFSISYQWRPAGGVWSDITIISRSLNTDEYREMVQVMVSGSADKSYDLKVWRSTDEGSSASDVDTLYLDMMDSFTEDPVSGSTLPIVNASRYRLSAIKVQATNQINGVLERVNAIAHARYRDYSGVGTGPDSWVVAETENPASALLYILTDPKVNPRPMEDGDIVWEDFEAWHAFCEAQGYTIGALVSGDITIDSIADQILATGRAEKRQHGGLFGIRIDQSNVYVAQMFTPRNSWGFSMDRDYSTKPSNLVVKFINKDLDYVEVERTISFTSEGSIVYDTPQDGPTEEISIPLVTDATQVSKLAAYVLMALHARVRSYSWNADIEGLLCVPGDVVLIANDGVFFGLGEGRITTISRDVAGLTTRVKLDTPVTMEVGQTYGLEIRTSVGIVKCQVNNTGKTTKWLTLTESLDHPLEEGALAAFGLLDTVTHKVLIEKIQPDGLRHCKISAVDYAEEIYSAEGIIPPYNSGVSRYREGLVSPGTGVRQPVGILPPPGRPGLTGEDAKTILLSSTSTTITKSSRGVIRSGNIVVSALMQHLPLPETGLTWEVVPAGAVTLENPSSGDPFSKIVNVGSLQAGLESVRIDCSVEFEDSVYKDSAGIVVVKDGLPAPKYLGSLVELPTEYNGEPLIDGDFFLYVGQDGGIPGYLRGHYYELASGSWIDETDAHVTSEGLHDALKIAEDEPTFFAASVYTQTLGANRIVMSKDGEIGSEDFAVDESGKPISGYKLDNPVVGTGRKGRLRAHGGVLVDVTVHGNLIHPALETRNTVQIGGPTIFAQMSKWNRALFFSALNITENTPTFQPIALSVGGTSYLSAKKIIASDYETNLQVATTYNSTSQATNNIYHTSPAQGKMRFNGTLSPEYYTWTTFEQVWVPTVPYDPLNPGYWEGQWVQHSAISPVRIRVYIDGILKYDKTANSSAYTYNVIYDVQKGSSIHVQIDRYEKYQYGTIGGSATLTINWRALQNTILLYNDTLDWDVVPNTDYLTEAHFVLTSPSSFDSDDHLEYALANTFIDVISALPEGVLIPVDYSIVTDAGSPDYGLPVSRISYGLKVDEAIHAVMNDGAGARVYYSDNSFDSFIAGSSVDGTSFVGWYIAEAQFVLVETEAVLIGNLVPKNGSIDIGEPDHPIRSEYVTNMYMESLHVGGMEGFACRAWVNFNNGSIRAGAGVSAITRIYTGVYRIHFSPPMPDTNYALAAIARDVNTNDNNVSVAYRFDDTKTVDYVDITVSVNGYYDSSEVNVLVIR